MMIIRTLSLILLACTLALSSACTATVHEESTGQYIDSSAITMKVKSKLMADERVKGYAITVKTYKDEVQLSGFVDTAEQRSLAASIASKVEGVKSVLNGLVIKSQ